MGQMAKYFLCLSKKLTYDFLRNKPANLTIRPGLARQFGGGYF